ncbi:MAG: hypothetical protein MUC50_24320, partial [Myxococcota bacterium]|nr:hypothetical protein [Myxococcota bacterium]
MSKFQTLLLTSLALLFTSCESPSPADPDEVGEVAEVGEVRQALSGCTPAMLDSATCSGAWKYKHYKDCSGQFPECGPKFCPKWNTCQHSSFGYLTTKTESSYEWSIRDASEDTCRELPDGGM